MSSSPALLTEFAALSPIARIRFTELAVSMSCRAKLPGFGTLLAAGLIRWDPKARVFGAYVLSGKGCDLHMAQTMAESAVMLTAMGL